MSCNTPNTHQAHTPSTPTPTPTHPHQYKQIRYPEPFVCLDHTTAVGEHVCVCVRVCVCVCHMDATTTTWLVACSIWIAMWRATWMSRRDRCRCRCRWKLVQHMGMHVTRDDHEHDKSLSMHTSMSDKTHEHELAFIIVASRLCMLA